MTTTFILIRHGETKWNLERRMQGQTDVPLNANGEKQAEQVSNYLRHYPIHVFYSSPLKRTLRTARIIQKHHHDAPIVLHHALKERSFGLTEGKTYEELAIEYPVLSFGRSWNHPQFQIPGGERLIDVYRRGNGFIHEIVEKERGKTVAIVAHGVIIRCMISSLLQLPLAYNYHYELGNTSITLIRKPQEGAAELHVINHTVHL